MAIDTFQGKHEKVICTHPIFAELVVVNIQFKASQIKIFDGGKNVCKSRPFQIPTNRKEKN